MKMVNLLFTKEKFTFQKFRIELNYAQHITPIKCCRIYVGIVEIRT